MNILQKFAITTVLLATAPMAWADVYKCLDEEGHVTYTNTKPSPKAKCTALSRDQRVSTVPAGRAAPATPSPAGFPKVDGDTQKARDTDRRKILEQELATEQKNLDQAKKELSEQEAVRTGDERNYDRVIARLQPYKDKVAVHERNIEALKKEIGTLK
jgi:septal ring factor EnvC (AmiA/AmiB activator)